MRAPAGLIIALLFVAMILVVSVVSRVRRATELRVRQVVFDDTAEAVLAKAREGSQPVRFIANKLHSGDSVEYDDKSLEVRLDNHLKGWQAAIFLEVEITDPSDVTSPVSVRGVAVGRHQVLRASGTPVPNALAAVLLAIRDRMPKPPHAYFEWSERATGENALRFLLGGGG